MSPDAAIVRELAPAKVNLALRVLGRRADGYHLLESLVAFADVGDRVVFEPGRPMGIDVAGPFAPAIVGENLVTRTMDLLAQAFPHLRLGYIRLEKHLPVAAGIGGGSADAAAVLRAVARSNPGALADADWSAIAARLGADVPVCLAARAAHVGGIGESVVPVAGLPPLAGVLVNPMVEVPADKTARVFRRLAAPPWSSAGGKETALLGLPGDAIGFIDWLARFGNDLEPPAIAEMPAVRDVLDALRQLPSARLVRMSGAGPTSFALFDGAGEASQAADHLRRRHPGWWIRAVTLA